jgi:proprotein convertase subtilisin/kexin type 2
MEHRSLRYLSFRKGAPLLLLMALFSACGGGGGGGSGSVTSEQNNVALGPVSGAVITVSDLDGKKLSESQSGTYDPAVDTLDDNQTLVPFARQQVGKYTVKIPSGLDPDAFVLIRAEGGVDIDPDDDGDLSTGGSQPILGSLLAYVKVSDLLEGNTTLNAFSTLAAEFVRQQEPTSRSDVSVMLANLSALIFKEAASDTPLYGFNPAQLGTDGNMTDLALLADPNLYEQVMNYDTVQELYAGSTHLLADTDKDGLFDDLELMIGSNVNDPNADGDQLNDYGEFFAGTMFALIDATADSDTLYQHQWHLENTGQAAGSGSGGTPGNDIGVLPVWETYAGSRSITVGVIDTGVEAAHPDLADNLDLTRSIRYSDGSNDPSPSPAQLQDDPDIPNDGPYISAHGTACAGLIAGTGWNGFGVRGVAPFTKVAGYNVFPFTKDSYFLDALGEDPDIFSNSWGYSSIALVSNPPLVSVLESQAGAGRGGKGTVFVFAAGNDRGTLALYGLKIGNANNSDILNNPYVITVAAVNADGRYSSYSNFGSNILVSAPGGEFGIDDPAIVTTDLTGLTYGLDSWGFADEFRGGIRFDVPGNEEGDYTNYMNGTSAATPIVSGVAALMLDANPDLTYRDVQYILATTAWKNDPTNGEWTTNDAGYDINQNYGFGLVDAEAAVATAATFTTLPSLVVTAKQTKNPNVSIPDNSAAGIASTINVSDSLSVEHVDVWVSIPDHTWPGDLDIRLISPSGTESRLAYGGAGYYVDNTYDNWRFSTVRCLDEDASGTWTLEVRDLASNDIGTLTSWSLQIRGH